MEGILRKCPEFCTLGVDSPFQTNTALQLKNKKKQKNYAQEEKTLVFF